MANATKRELMTDVATGLIAGLLGTAALSAISSAVLRATPSRVRAREQRARGREYPFEILVRRAGRNVLGGDVPPRVKIAGGQLVHWAWGIACGALYGVARKRSPALARFAGLPFGLAVFAGSDEFLTAALGLAPPPRRLPFATHARGLVAHIGYGVACEMAARGIDRALTPRAAAELEKPAPPRIRQEPRHRSIVDEASEESFPASDAPAWSIAPPRSGV